MYGVTVEQSDGNKLKPAKGDTLASIAASDKCEPGTTWQRIALYNWGTTDANEVNRALVELVGCSAVDASNPEKSVLDPELGTTQALYIPRVWTPPISLAVEKTHTVKVRKRLPAPAAVLTKLDPWFIPETETCDVGYRIEGVAERADKLDFDVYASNYCKATPTADDGFFKYAFAAVDVPIRQKRAFTPATVRKADTITDWKGESEAKDGMLKPRADDKKRYVDVACSPYTVVIRYYKADADKDARITLKSFWPRFKKVLKSAADTDGIDGAAAGVKAKTEAALKAARELDVATRIAEEDVAALVAATERAAVRAHAAVKAADKAATDAATAQTAIDQVKTDADLTKAAYDSNAVDKDAKFAAFKVTVTDARTKANTAKTSTIAAAAALEVAKAAAAQAKAKAAISKASKADAATKAETAKTKVGEAKTAAAATAPKTLKELAEAAATKADAAKTKADAAKSAADTASTSATQCDSDAASPATKAGEARDDEKAAVDALLGIYAAPMTVANLAARATTAKTKAGTAKTKADATKPLATTLQTAADKSRTDAAKVIRAVADARAEALALLGAVDATDDEVVNDKSLEVTWKIEKTDKVKHGQLLVLDKEDKVVFRKPLKDSDLTKDTETTCDLAADDQAKYWLDEKTKLDLSPSRMPYRAQLQAHSAWDETEGVALVAMHTEVRLWSHKDSGTHTVPLEDSPSLRFGLAPFRPDKDPPGSGTDEWYRLKLAEAGFHPGPVNTTASAGATDPYQVALAEFQRSFPKEEKKPFTRLVCDGAKNGPTKDVLARTDVADKAHTKSVDIKAKTTATLDAAKAAQTDAEKASTEADAAQADAAQAATLADEAATLAGTAATDAAAAKDAVDQAKTDTDAAADAQKVGAADAPAKAQAAVLSAGLAVTRATAAAASADSAATKATAAKNAADTAATKAGAAKTSAAEAAPKIATVKTKAEEAKNEAAAADPSVKGPVDDCDTKAVTADTSAKKSKTSGEAAETSILASKTDAAKAATSADKTKTDAAALEAAAETLKTSVQAGTFAQAQGLAATAATDAATAKASADQAKTDVAALEGKTDQGKVDGDKLKADAAQAKTDAVAVALAAKAAEDAAEADRAKKKQKKDDVDKVYRPVREMFGNPAGQADYTGAQAAPLLGDKGKELIVWVDDRHYYDDGAEIPEIKVGDYRGNMTIGDTKVDKEKSSVARPWIPLEAQLPLMGKAQGLDASGDPPAVTDAMRRAIGPLRVDWTFEELPISIEETPGAGSDHAKTIAAYSRAVTVKEKTALALTAATAAKAAATAPVTRTTAAQTELGKLVTAADEAGPLAAQAVTDAAAAQTAADTAKNDADAAASAVGEDVATKGAKAKQSCELAAAKAATAVQSATAADDKVGTAKTSATAMATEAGHAKTDAATLADKVDDFLKKLEDADIAADIAQSAGAVTTALSETSKAADKSKESADLTKADTAKAETSCNKCRDDATTAETAAKLVKSRAEALQATAELAKGHADGGRWGDARTATATASTQAGEAKSAADQAKVDVATLKASTDKAKPEVDKAKTEADKAKPEAEAIEAKAQTADTEADSDKLSRQAAADLAGGAIDPTVAASQGTRARAYLAHMLGKDGMGKVVDGKLYTNCPATAGGKDYGGIRPDSLDTYYKAPFGIAKTGSNRPWLSIDDTTNKIVCSVVHDDLGQDEAHVFPEALGKAGIYLNPSRIAGDGYRYRAQVSFKELPADSHPNREALLGRYVRPPASHTAALRLWRKSAFRGYVRWTPAAEAGWQAVMTEVREIYRAARVHFIHAGPDPNAATEFALVGAVAPDELITAAEYQDCINGKVSGPYNGVPAKYSAGYIWPYLDRAHYAVPQKAGKIQAMIDYFYAGLMDDTWRKFRAKLLHLVLKKIEANGGTMRGHTLIEFKASPKVVLVEYKCNAVGCASVFTEVANDPGGATVVDGEKVTLHAPNTLACTAGACAGKYVEAARRVLNGFPLAAVGCALGGTWLFTPRDAAVWAHELGHHRHLEHAQANSGKDQIAPGGKVGQHDSQANAAQASAAYANQKFWDRWCIMSYDDKGEQHFCGKCLLKTAGWRVEDLANPAGTVSDA